MSRRSQPKSPAVESWREAAMLYPEVEEGIVCNKASFKVRNKGFVFIGMDDQTYNVMLKLRDSLAEAETLAAREPARYKVGKHGWVTLTFAHNESPPAELRKRWLDESYRLFAPAKKKG